MYHHKCHVRTPVPGSAEPVGKRTFSGWLTQAMGVTSRLRDGGILVFACLASAAHRDQHPGKQL